MARVDPLFELIRSLSKSEKRYFKLFAGMQGRDKKYLLLFDAVDELEEYDEDILKQRFADEKFVRQFSVAKNYLRTMIMKSLRLYHSGGSTLSRLHEMMIDAEILTDRGLRSQARKVAVKAEKIARRYGRFHIEVEAVVRRHGLEERTTMTAEGLRRMAAEQRDVLRRLENLVEFGILFYEVGRLVSRGNDVRSPAGLAELDRLMASPLLQSPEEALSPRALMRYHWIRAANHYARGESDESLAESLAIVELIESDESLLPEHIGLYVAAVSNGMLIHQQRGARGESDLLMQKLRTRARRSAAQMKRPSREEGRIFSLLYGHILAVHAKQREFEKGIDLIPEIEEGLDLYGDVLDPTPRFSILMHLCSLCTAAGEYRRALDYNNRILLEPEPIEGGAIYRSARLLNLVIHYELGNRRLLKTLLPATERFLRARDALHGVESSVLNLLEDLAGVRSPQQEVDLFTRFRDRLLELQNDPLERHPLHFFSYVAWAERHLPESSQGSGSETPAPKRVNV